MTHPNAGDLIFAIVDPAGELHALGVRPGVDEASDGSGAAAGSLANVAADPRIGSLVGDPVTYADIETLGDLVSYNKNDLLKFRNFGKKSLTELEDLVENKGLSFGMNLSKYKLDKE